MLLLALPSQAKGSANNIHSLIYSFFQLISSSIAVYPQEDGGGGLSQLTLGEWSEKPWADHQCIIGLHQEQQRKIAFCSLRLNKPQQRCLLRIFDSELIM